MHNKVLCNLNLLHLALAGLAMMNCSQARVSSSQDGAMLNIHYVSIGVETYTAVTSENVEQRGSACVVTKPSDVAEIRRILASATPALRNEDMFTNKAVRVKITEKSDGIGEHLVAIVENHGPVRSGNANRVLSEKALVDLKKLIEAACKFS